MYNTRKLHQKQKCSNIGLQFLARGSFDFTWNPPDFMKSVWNPPDFMKSIWNVLDFMKSVWNLADFRWNPPKLRSFCWNIWIYKVLGGFHMKSVWNLADFRWNPPAGFQIMSFCVMIKYRSFDFWKTNQMFQQKLFWLVFWKMKDLYLIITQKAHNFEIWWISCRFHVKSGGFYEILGHSPHLAFIKLKSFCWKHLLL